MTSDPRYTIGDLAALAGATPRTVRYYVAQGLLPAPAGAGAGAHYTDAHLARLRLIRRLQRQHLPLSEIRQRLASLADAEIAALVAEEEPPAPPDSALDYLRTVLGSSAAPTSPTTATPPMPMRPMQAPSVVPQPAPPGPSAAPSEPAALAARPLSRLMRAPSFAEAPAPPASTEVSPAGDEAGETSHRSQWDRIGLTPNIELHVRRPLGRLENKRVERLITIARQILKEDQP